MAPALIQNDEENTDCTTDEPCVRMHTSDRAKPLSVLLTLRVTNFAALSVPWISHQMNTDRGRSGTAPQTMSNEQ